MKRAVLPAILSSLFCAAALAQQPHAEHSAPPPDTPAGHAGHAASSDAPEAPATGASLPVGTSPPPPAVRDHVADRLFDGAAMNRARDILAAEHGAHRFSKFMTNLAEITSGSGGGYRWDIEGWYGGDLQRFVFKSEGEGMRRGGLDSAEIQALYSRAVGRYTDVQAGVRYDLEPDGRAYATLAVESLLPYWFRVDAALFVSDRGDVFSRLEGSHDLQLTQRFVLQPRAELSLAAQDVRDAGVGSGLSTAELGVRVRYEIRRELAPYIGVSYETALGRTANFARVAGERTSDTRLVLGVQAWF